MVSYFHGVETADVILGGRPVSVVRSAVIGLVGTAPLGDKNTLIRVQNPSDAAQFGSQINGFTIPQALNDIFQQGNTTVLVVNVYNPGTNQTSVVKEVVNVVGTTAKLAFAPLSTLTIFLADGTTSSTAVLGTDYTIDSFGNITVISSLSDLAPAAELKISYSKYNAGSVTNDQIIGAVDGTTNARTGLKCFQLAYNTFGFKAKVFIAPGFSSVSAIATELLVVANANKGMRYLDAPSGTTKAVAIAGRGPSGAINFYTSDTRSKLLFPMPKRYGVQNAANETGYYSSFAAGNRAAVDNNEGYHVSSSNHPLVGVLGMEIPISAEINNPNTDANDLNEVGITTFFNSFGTGIREWGNRNAAFPTDTTPISFESVQRTRDVVEDSIELASLPFIDKPINDAIISSIMETVNTFLRTLSGRGVIIDGECTFDRTLNSDDDIAAGHLTFTLSLMPPTPLERLTFNSSIDTSLLKALVSPAL